MTSHAWKAMAAALALLVIGAVLGVTFDRYHVRARDHGTTLLAEIERDPMAVLEREIGLRPDQRAPISAILQRWQATLDSVWGESNRQVRVAVVGVVDDIAAQLDSSQTRRFHALIDQIHSSPRSMFHGQSH
jgi:hypothetical protein